MESGESQMKLIERPRDYSVQFSFPEVCIVLYGIVLYMMSGSVGVV